MPYIGQGRRSLYKDIVNMIRDVPIHSVGDLAYLIAILQDQYMSDRELNFSNLSEVISATVAALSEFQEIVKTYEAVKLAENGEVYLSLAEKIQPVLDKYTGVESDDIDLPSDFNGEENGTHS